MLKYILLSLGVCLVCSADPLPPATSPFSRTVLTNTDAAGWRTAIGAGTNGGGGIPTLNGIGTNLSVVSQNGTSVTNTVPATSGVDLSWSTGVGGSTSVSNDVNAGNGGSWVFTSGAGGNQGNIIGNSSDFDGDTAGGAGGSFTFVAGTGGNAHDDNTGGNGGNIGLSAGNGGTTDAGNNGQGGSVGIVSGMAGKSSTNGEPDGDISLNSYGNIFLETSINADSPNTYVGQLLSQGSTAALWWFDSFTTTAEFDIGPTRTVAGASHTFRADGNFTLFGPIAPYTDQTTSPQPNSHNVPGIVGDMNSTVIQFNAETVFSGPVEWTGNMSVAGTNIQNQTHTNIDFNLGNPNQYYLPTVFGLTNGVSNITMRIETQDVDGDIHMFVNQSAFTNYVVSDGDHCFFDGQTGHIRLLSLVGKEAFWFGRAQNGLTLNGIGASNWWNTVSMGICHHWTERGTNWVICATNGVFRSNYVANVIFTNTYDVPVIISEGNALLTTAAVAGYSQLTAEIPGVITNRCTSSSLATVGFVGTETNAMGSITLLPKQTIQFKDTSSGAGNSASGDFYQITTQ